MTTLDPTHGFGPGGNGLQPLSVSQRPRERLPSPLPRESLTARRARAAAVLEGLRACYPDAKTELDFGTPLPLVVADADRVPAIAVDTEVERLARRLGFCRPSSECMLAVLS